MVIVYHLHIYFGANIGIRSHRLVQIRVYLISSSDADFWNKPKNLWFKPIFVHLNIYKNEWLDSPLISCIFLFMLAKHSVNIYLNSVLTIIQSVFVPPKLRGTQTSEFTIDVKLLLPIYLFLVRNQNNNLNFCIFPSCFFNYISKQMPKCCQTERPQTPASTIVNGCFQLQKYLTVRAGRLR